MDMAAAGAESGGSGGYREGSRAEMNPTLFGRVATSEQTNEIAENGAFVRQANRFCVPFGSREGELPVEAGRYRLIWTPLCPWATRQRIVLKLLGIGEDVIITCPATCMNKQA